MASLARYGVHNVGELGKVPPGMTGQRKRRSMGTGTESATPARSGFCQSAARHSARGAVSGRSTAAVRSARRVGQCTAAMGLHCSLATATHSPSSHRNRCGNAFRWSSELRPGDCMNYTVVPQQDDGGCIGLGQWRQAWRIASEAEQKGCKVADAAAAPQRTEGRTSDTAKTASARKPKALRSARRQLSRGLTQAYAREQSNHEARSGNKELTSCAGSKIRVARLHA